MHLYIRAQARAALLSSIVAAPLLAGCASNMANMWRDETFKHQPLQNVLVIALRPEEVRRRVWEDSFVHGLDAFGVKGTASYRLWAEALPDTQQVIEAIQRDKYDGVLALSRQPDGVEQTYMHGYTVHETVTQQSPFTGAYFSVWKAVQVPGRTETVAVANFKTDVWVTGQNGRLVWSGSCRSTNRVNAALVRHEVEKEILPELSRAGIISAKRK